MTNDPASFLSEARRRAGLSQRALAERAGTAQSVVARIEAGTVSPGWSTLTRLLAAAGCELRAHLAVGSDRTHMLDDVARILSLTPEERLVELHNANRLFVEARRVS